MSRSNYLSLANLFLCVVAIALVLVGVATGPTSPLAILFPTLVGWLTIITMGPKREKR